MTIAAPPSPPALYKCSACAAVQPKKSKRLPRGWKNKQGEYFCADCWKARHILRAISMPVVAPVDSTWEELRTALKLMWRETTRASNWMMTQCYTRDVRRVSADEEKLAPMPKIYLYPEARLLFPALPSQSVAALEQAITRKYRPLRYKIIWTAQMSLPVFRYPTPDRGTGYLSAWR